MASRQRVLMVGLVAFLAACGGSEVDGLSGDPGSDELAQLAAELGTLDMHNLLTDEDMAGFDWVTVSQVQSFLKAKGSFLAGYTDPVWKKTAAQLIVERSRAYDINPVYMLARIDTESSLVRSGTSKYLAQATGCGCPAAGCDSKYAGFGNQIECSASKFRGYLQDLEAGKSTITGWKPGVTKKSFDGCLVTPANNATAALYTYTPWVGSHARQCGTSQWGGSSLVAVIYKLFKDGGNWGVRPPLVVDTDNARNNSSKARFSASSSWYATSSASNYFGTNYFFASTSPVSDAADFWFFMPAAGERKVEAWWTAGTNRSASAPFVIENAEGARLGVTRVNQRINGGKWNSLGTFQFSAGWNRVRLSRWTTPGYVVIADAVRIR